MSLVKMQITMQWNDYCFNCNKFLSKGRIALRKNSNLFCNDCGTKTTFARTNKNFPKEFSRIGTKWTNSEKNYLEKELQNGTMLENIARKLKRTTNATRSQIKLLKLYSQTGRFLPPSIYQLKLIEHLGGYRLKLPKSTKDASTLIDELMYKNGWKLEPLSSQFDTLKFLRYLGPRPESMLQARKLIDDYLSKNLKKYGIQNSFKNLFEVLTLLKKQSDKVILNRLHTILKMILWMAMKKNHVLHMMELDVKCVMV